MGLLCIEIKHTEGITMKEEKIYIQVQAEAEDRRNLSDIAKYRGVTMSAAVRAWIRTAHKSLPEEAKQQSAA